MAPPADIPEPFCLACGYDLSGTPDGRCSECGQRFDRAAFYRRIAESRMSTGTLLLTLAVGPLFFLTWMIAVTQWAETPWQEGQLTRTGAFFGMLLSVVGGWQVATGIGWLQAVLQRRVPRTWAVFVRKALVFGCLLICQAATMLMTYRIMTLRLG